MPIIKKGAGKQGFSGIEEIGKGGGGLDALRIDKRVNSSFEDSDFTSDDEIQYQSNVMIFGKGGEGKSTLVTMYAPEPVAVISFDGRAKEPVREARKVGRTIHHTYIPFDAKDILKLDEANAAKLCRETMDRVVHNYEIAIRESQKGNVRTICFDTGTEYDQIVTIAIRGHLDKANDYGRSKNLINQAWWHIFNTARQGNAHLVVLARDKEIWGGSEPTGRFTFRGPEVMYDGVDWVGNIRLKAEGKGKVKRKTKEFELEIVKAGVNIEQLGEVYTKEEWEDFGGPFVYACVMQYDGSSPEDWQ